MNKRVRWELLWTSVGLKVVMALSGALLSGWILLHMAGNLLVFAGPEQMNAYGGALQGSPLLWGIRLGLLACAAVHVGAAVVLTRRARGARRSRYRVALSAQRSSPASRSMRWGGLTLALFTAYHVAHIYGPLHDSYVPGDVHHNLVAGLASPLTASLYVAATLVLGLHLYHGTFSMFGSLGHGGRFERGLRKVSIGFCALITVGFLLPCVAALAGWV